jgi:hypothetical protein
MRWSGGPGPFERIDQYFRSKYEWRRWFAWRPVRIDAVWIWWEYVERQKHCFDMPGDYTHCWYEYRTRSDLSLSEEKGT